MSTVASVRATCDAAEHGAQRRGGPDDLFEHRRFVDVLAQDDVLVAQPLFRLFAIVDIRRRDVLPQHPSELVANRAGAGQKPPVGPIPPAQPEFRLAIGSSGTSWFPTSAGVSQAAAMRKPRQSR
jgi:hypothetical protein